jgi:hypothetical protein
MICFSEFFFFFNYRRLNSRILNLGMLVLWKLLPNLLQMLRRMNAGLNSKIEICRNSKEKRREKSNKRKNAERKLSERLNVEDKRSND